MVFPHPHKLHTSQAHLPDHLNTRGVDHGGLGGANPIENMYEASEYVLIS